MQLIAAIGGLAFIVSSLVIGASLLLVARRTREMPELVLGFGLFLTGASRPAARLRTPRTLPSLTRPEARALTRPQTPHSVSTARPEARSAGQQD